MHGNSLRSAISLDKQLQVTEIVASFQQLRGLDNVWTAHLQNATAIPDSDVELLRSLTKQMDELLGKCQVGCQSMRQLVTEQPDVLEAVYSELLANLPTKQQRRLQAMVKRAGGIAKFATESAEGVLQRIPKEREELAAKMSLIERGCFTHGDLSDAFWCGVLANTAVASAFLLQPELLFGALVVADQIGC